MVVISETISKLYFNIINDYFKFHFKENYKIITIPTGECNKNIGNVLKICEYGKDFKLDRNALIVAIGGGILMDIVGFASSMYKRKIEYLRIPTTLVGQIDAGIGIKTGINFFDSKNFLGSYHPPIASLNDIKLLKTLPQNEILCGLAEIIKMAIVKDAVLFEIIEYRFTELINYNFQQQKNVTYEVHQRSILSMLEELNGNFHEHILERKVDFGHTFSPFIEVHTNYRIPHGAAVALDIAISTELMFIKNGISKNDRDRILNLVLQIGLEIYSVETFLPDLMWESLQEIYLHRGMSLNLVVPKSIGEVVFIKNINEVSQELLNTVFLNLKRFQAHFFEKEAVFV